MKLNTKDVEEVFLLPIEESDFFDEAFDELKVEQRVHLEEALNSF